MSSGFLSPTDTFQFRVAGVKFEGRQDILSDLYYKGSMRGNPIVAALEREKNNKYDSNAIKVMAGIIGEGISWHIGYVPRELAAKLAPRIDKGEIPDVVGVRIVEAEDYRGRYLTYGAKIEIIMRKPRLMRRKKGH